MQKLVVLIVICFLVMSPLFAATYTWNVTSGSWQTAGSWNPMRTTPAVGDVLIFDGTVNKQANVSNILDQTISQLKVINGCTVNFSAQSTGADITLNINTSGLGLLVDSGSQLQFAGTRAINMVLSSLSKGTVNGDVLYLSGNVPHILSAGSANGLIFTNGATFQFAPSNNSNNPPFGAGVANSVIFQSGATYYQSGTKTTPSNGNSGDPFAKSAPASVTDFQPGSLIYSYDPTNNTYGGRTVGNITFDNRGGSAGIGEADLKFVVINTCLFKSTATGIISYDHNGAVYIGGDFIIEAGSAGFQDITNCAVPTPFEVKGGQFKTLGFFDGNVDPQRIYLFDGLSQQTITIAINSTFTNLKINNPLGVVLGSDIAVSENLNLTNGNIYTNSHDLTLGTSKTQLGSLTRTSGTIVNRFTQWIDTSKQPYAFPVGTSSTFNEATVNFTDNPDRGGTLTAIFTASNPGINGLPLPDGTVAISSVSQSGFWTISTGNGVLPSTYTLTLEANGFTFSVPTANWRIIKRANSSTAWYLDGNAGTNSGVAIVRTGMNGYSDFAIGQGTIARPIAGFYSTPTIVYAPANVAFTDTSLNSPTSWAWDFGDGGTSTTQNPVHQYGAVEEPTCYTVTLIATNAAGSDTAIKPCYIQVTEPGPGGNGTGLGFYGTPTSGYGPLQVNFTDTTGGNPTSWAWDFGDGATDNVQNPQHTYAAVTIPTAYTVQLILSNNFGSATVTKVNYIYVTEPAPGGNGTGLGFYGTPTSGYGPLQVNFTDTTGGNPTSWAWDFGDGATDNVQNPQHTYAVVTVPTAYTVTLALSNAFGSATVTKVDYIFVTELAPDAGFYATPSSGNTPLNVNFTDTSANNPTSWDWNFGDGGTDNVQNPSHLYATVSEPTSYAVRLIACNAFGCSTSYGASGQTTPTDIIFVVPPAPDAGFYATPTSGNTPLNVNFTDTSANNPTSWDWDFGDGGTDNIQNPSHLYATVSEPTSYAVRLIACNAYGCSTSYGASGQTTPTDIIFVVPAAPNAGFYTDVTTGIGPLTVLFTDTSDNSPTSWAWDFGDGATSNNQNPSHAYSAVTGDLSYTVRLIASNTYGSGTATLSNFITILQQPPEFHTELPDLKLFVDNNTSPQQNLVPAFDIKDFIPEGSANTFSVVSNFLSLTSLSGSTVNEGTYGVPTVGLNSYGASGISSSTVSNLVKYSTYKIQKLPKIGLTVGSSYVVNVASYTLSNGASLPPTSFGDPGSISVSDFTKVTAYWSGNTAVVITALGTILGKVNVDIIAAPVAGPPYGVDIDKERVEVYTNLLANGTFATAADTSNYGLEPAPGRNDLSPQSWLANYTDSKGTQASGVWKITFADSNGGFKATPFPYNWLSVYTSQGNWYTARMRVVADTPNNNHQTILYSFSNLVNTGLSTNIGGNVLFGTPTTWTWLEAPFLLHVQSTSGYPQVQLKAGGAGSIYIDELQFIKAAPTLVDAQRASTRYKYANGDFDVAADTTGWGKEIYLGAGSTPAITVSAGSLRLDFAGADSGPSQKGIKWTASTTGTGAGLITPAVTPGRELGMRLSITKESGTFDSLLLVTVSALGVQSNGAFNYGIPPSNIISEAGLGPISEGEYRTVGKAINGFYQFQFGIRSDQPGVIRVDNIDFDRDIDDPNYGDSGLYPTP